MRVRFTVMRSPVVYHSPMKRVLLAARCSRLSSPAAARPTCRPAGRSRVTVSQDFGADPAGARPRPDRAERRDRAGAAASAHFEVTPSGGGVQEIGGVSGGQEDGKPRRLVLLRQRHRGRPRAPASASSTRATASGGTTTARGCGRPGGRGLVPGAVHARASTARSCRSGSSAMGAEDRSCDEVETRLQAARDRRAGALEPRVRRSGEVLRILVGRWTRCAQGHRRPDARARARRVRACSRARARRAPRSSCSTPTATSQDARRRAPGWSPPPATSDQRPTWIITGTDDVGVAAAAAALTEDDARHRFALAIEQGRGVALAAEGRRDVR